MPTILLHGKHLPHLTNHIEFYTVEWLNSIFFDRKKKKLKGQVHFCQCSIVQTTIANEYIPNQGHAQFIK